MIMLVLKGALGALVMVAITLIAKSKNFYVAGLVPLFPTFTIIAHYVVAREQSHTAAKETILFSMWAVIPYFLYLLTTYFLIDRIRIELAIAYSIGVWMISATALFMCWAKFAQVTS